MFINRILNLIKLDKLVSYHLNMINRFNISDHIKLYHHCKVIHHKLNKHKLFNHSLILI